uniref:Potassium channel domain-containing protein n=1 Tax=Heliothis virescens TaxID=7102 RepID=A0A2A4IXM9_HELVI
MPRPSWPRYELITPLSPRWRSAIERRIEEERRLTMKAVSHGARIHPGQFWDLSGTFLFTVYVMTALGFGAPVPQTWMGRTSALIYAAFAVPTHFYLMLNASMCIVVRIEACLNRLRCDPDKRDTVLHNGTESPNCSRSSEVLKSTRSCVRKNIMRLLGVLGVCRWMFLTAVLYYLCGAVAFGLVREREPLDIAMFPLEFTTSGGLDRVTGYVRILYGWYVEGAVMLLSCGLATLRQHSGSAVSCMADKYKLFETQ